MEKEVLDQMLQRIKEGSDSDFIDLTHKYDAVIKSLTKSYFEKCKHLGAEYEDLQQEAAMGLYKAAMTYRLDQDGVTFGLYAKICITNRLISVQRKLIRANNKKIAKESHVQKNVHTGRTERYDVDVERCACVLSKLECDVFYLFLEGCSYGEIAQTLHKDVKSVDNAMYRIRKKLKELSI